MSTFFLEVENNEIVQRRVMVKYFTEMKAVDGSYRITIEKGKKRSLPMNSFLHGVLIPEFRKALNSVGYRVNTDEEAKQVFKAMFCTYHIDNEVTNEQIPIVRDTSKMTTVELSVIYDECIKFAAEHMNYIIPYPGEKLNLDL